MAHGVVAGPAWPAGGPAAPGAAPVRRWGRLPGRRMLFGLTTYGLAQAVLLFWWVARYPGLFSPDSLDHVWQASSGNWNTHHPVTYTGLVWVSMRLTGGIGVLTLAQTCALAAGLAYAVTGLRRLGGPNWGWIAAAVAVVALPPVGTFVVCVWKDVPFVICHVFLLGTVARLVARRPTTDGPGPTDDPDHPTHQPTGPTHQPTRPPADRTGPAAARRCRNDAPHPLPRVLFGAILVELTLICLFRQNGFLVVAVVTALVVWLLRGAALRVLLAGMLAATAALATNWVLLPTLGVRDSESIVAYEAFLSDLAIGYAADPMDLPAADAALLARVAPLAHWRRSATCHTVDPTVYHPDFDRRAAATHRDELLSAWWRLVRRSPGTVLAARACRSSIAWRPTPSGGLRVNPTAWALPIYLDRDPKFRDAGVRAVAYSQPLSDRAARVADRLSRLITEPEWLLWRGATWAYLAYLTVGLLAWRRRDRALLTLATLSAGNQLSVLLVNNAQAARYMAAPFVLGVLLLPLLAAGQRPPRPAGTGTGPEPAHTPTPVQPLRVIDLTVAVEPPVRKGPLLSLFVEEGALPNQPASGGQARLEERG
ncbi:hypothetical protein [Plantactinospora soyae]|uniref:Uncharacterized protein n=1 Tax=Plantactinospora soyae TaxID=1544732 RepID=A0A927M603_9ACTN|nr:hypothetical protein [Plantactinospora soyae]MBE1487632.1 hypothetical protein [Plantactinospora soyae]